MLLRRRLAFAIILIVLPFALNALWNLFPSVGLIPYLPYQLYYAPLGLWLGEPFFAHDNELGIVVLPLGAIATPIFYLSLFGFAIKAAKWARGRRRVDRIKGRSA